MKSFTLSILLLLTLPTFSQSKNDLKRQKLKGEPKSITEYEYTVAEDANEPVKDALKVKSVSTFNSDGFCTGFTTYSPEGAEQSHSVYNYNDSGALIDIKRYRADGGLNVTTSYKYDKLGNEAEESNYDPSGTLFMTGKGKYDLNGNRIVYDRYDGIGHLFLKTNAKFDKKGNVIEEREYDSHESLQFKTTYEYGNYDKKGNWLWKATFKNNKPRSIVEREITYN